TEDRRASGVGRLICMVGALLLRNASTCCDSGPNRCHELCGLSEVLSHSTGSARGLTEQRPRSYPRALSGDRASYALSESALRLPASSTSPAGSSWCPPNCRRMAESSWLA